MQGTGVSVLAALLAISVEIVALVVYKALTKRPFLGDIVLPAVFIVVACLFAGNRFRFPGRRCRTGNYPVFMESVADSVQHSHYYPRLDVEKIEPRSKIGRLDVLIKFIEQQSRT